MAMTAETMRFGPPPCPRCPGLNHWPQDCSCSPEALERFRSRLMHSLENVRVGPREPFFTTINPKGRNPMTTSVRVHVNGRYRATVKQGDREPVVVEGNYDGSPNPSGEHTFWLPHPAKETFEVTEEQVPDSK